MKIKKRVERRKEVLKRKKRENKLCIIFNKNIIVIFSYFSLISIIYNNIICLNIINIFDQLKYFFI